MRSIFFLYSSQVATALAEKALKEGVQEYEREARDV
jgi:hypothetical protein